MTHHEVKLIGGPFDGAVGEFDFPAEVLPDGPLEFGESMVYDVDGKTNTATFVSGSLSDEDREKLEELTG